MGTKSGARPSPRDCLRDCLRRSVDSHGKSRRRTKRRRGTQCNQSHVLCSKTLQLPSRKDGSSMSVSMRSREALEVAAMTVEGLMKDSKASLSRRLSTCGTL